MSRTAKDHVTALSLFLLAGLLLAVGAVSPAASQNVPESRDTSGTIRQMERLNRNEGWVLTDQALLYTRDGGASWFAMSSGQEIGGVTDAFFLGSSQVWLAGVDTASPGQLVVRHTVDGGTSWSGRRIAASALTTGVYARAQVHFADASHGWLLGKVATSAAFSLGELLRTIDGGRSWQRLPTPPAAGQFVFVDTKRGFMTGSPVSERLYRTVDGGRSWQEVELPVSAADGMTLYDLPSFRSRTHGTLAVTLRGDAPRLLTFVTEDGGQRWLPVVSQALPAGDYSEPVPAALSASGQIRALGIDGSVTLATETVPRTFGLTERDRTRRARVPSREVSARALSLDDEGSGWALVTEGGCEDGVCEQVTRLKAIGPSSGNTEVAEDLLVRTTEDVQLALASDLSSSGTVISFDKGFDKCAAATTAQMQTWKTASPYKDANIYYGGAARGCAQVNLNASWVSTVFQQGWRLIPTWVGPQAPCTGYGTRFSSNPTTARNQGLAEADAAVDGAAALGLGAGTPLYYDLELYAENNSSCSAAVRAFVNAWSERVRDRGYLAGVYGNARNAQADWRTGVIANPPDAVWLVPWVCGSTATSCNWTPTVFGIPGVNDAYWANNQRIRQYWGDHSETYGGVTFKIDSDYANAPVAAGQSSSCQETVPSGRWKGEYFNNMTLSGSPTMVRDDGGGSIDFDWGSGSPGSSCGVGADRFSARWTRTAHFDAGTYQFTVTSDDGFRLYVDGSLKLEKWFDQGPTTYTVDVPISAGNHTIRMDYYENGGGAVAKLSWKLQSNCFASVPSTSWRGQYFNNKTFSGSPAMVRNDGNGFLNFEWYGDSPSPACGFPADNFSVRWTRTVNFNAGTYRFTITSDDGFRLYVDGSLKLQKWFDQGPTTYTVDVPLSAGSHTLRLDYYENGGWAVAKLSWQAVSNGCVASVPSTSWRGQYFNNKTFSGSPAMVRNDGNGFLNFEWYSDSPSPACGFPADNFSVRWTRTVNFNAGTYRFTITSDDGFRLYVDGSLKLQKWFDQGPTTYTVDVPLSAGNHTIRMDYYENGGWAVAKLSWQALSNGCVASVPSTSWRGQYFNNKTFSGSPAMVRNDGNGFLNFDWNSGSPSTACGFPADNFSVRWTRTVSFNAGTYRFTITSDDGFRLYVDGSLKLQKWFDQGPTTYTVDVPLSAGNHTVRMDYYENGGGAVAKLSWQAVSTGPTVVVVDDLSSRFSRFGPSQYWWQASIGYQSHMFWTYVNGNVKSNYARWTPNLSSGGAGNYRVYVFVPRDNATSLQARYRIHHNGVDSTYAVNQSQYFDQWVSVGTYYFAANGSEYVELADATGEAGSTYRKIGFDAVKFEK